VSEEKSTGANRHRLNVNFAASTYEALEELARKQGKTKAEVLRDVIGLAKFIQDERDQGNHIVVERGNKTYEIVPL